jgi:hypothetical protein
MPTPVNRSPHWPATISRRDWLLRSGGGMGALALAALLQEESAQAQTVVAPQAANPLAPRPTHFPPRARRIIWLFMHGGPSQVDLFDPKPELVRHAGQPLPESYGMVMTRRNVANNALMPPIRPFRRFGQCGTEISELLPHTGACADDICVIRSCHGDSVNHPQAVYQVNTGSIQMGRPCVGSWVAFGLGTENQNMPAFVVMLQPDGAGGIKGGPPAWGSGYLPATFQGTTMRSGASPILNLHSSSGMAPPRQRALLDLVQQFNQQHLAGRDFDDELSARINAYELAFRMQSAAQEVVDISRESAATQRLYGIDEDATRDFGTRCLLARRMIEGGVRFVQLYSGDVGGWDAHSNVLQNHTTYCRRTDKPVAGLLRDLKARGLLDDTLVIWGGEFGRMPMNEGGTGRDHNPWGYSYWLAGGGIRGGITYGATDDFGLRAEEHPVHVHDLHATILHLLGMDHTRLTFFHNGRHHRLTDVHGHVVQEIVA